MSDITILFYTANLPPEPFASNIRKALLEVTRGIPIISISHKPMDFGTNICVGDLPHTHYSMFKQIWIGAQNAKTKYVACCEDDTLYTSRYFEYRPTDNVFAYNQNRYRVYKDCFALRYLGRHPTTSGMWNCIAPTELMVETLGKRFEKFPVSGSLVHWGEPGRYDHRLGLPRPQSYRFYASIPNVTFSHRGLGGKRPIISKYDTIERELPYWGKAEELWNRMWHGDG